MNVADSLDIRGQRTRIGLGAAALAQPHLDAANAETLVGEAWAQGIRTFDTAPMYGAGRSELLLGAALRSYPRDEYALSSKVGRLVKEGTRSSTGEWFFDFSADGIKRSVEESLIRLGADRLDTVYLHDPDDFHGFDSAVAEQAFATLEQLREQGLCAAVGIGMTTTPLLNELITRFPVDAVLLAGRYSLIDREAALEVLPQCSTRGIRVTIASALHAGLVDGTDSGNLHYDKTPPAVVSKVAEIADACRRYDVPVGAAALRFVLNDSRVSGVLTGPRTAAELRQNIEWSEWPIPTDLWQEIEQLEPARALAGKAK